MTAKIYIPTNSILRVPFTLHPHQRLLFVVVLMIDILKGVERYLIMVLIGTSWMISDAEHLFMCLLAIYMLSLKKMSIQAFSFLIGIVYLILSLYIFLVLTPYATYHLQIPSPIH